MIQVKTILAVATAIVMSTAVMAQDNNQDKKRERKPMDMTQMVERRTEDTAKKYGLNENQQAKLLELNKKYADQLQPRGRHGGPRGQFKEKGKQRPDGQTEATKQEGQQRKQPTEEQKAQMQQKRKVMEEKMAAYDAELQEIMTKEQFEAYKKDRQSQRPQRGQRPQRKAPANE